jgi:hypothetical protein
MLFSGRLSGRYSGRIEGRPRGSEMGSEKAPILLANSPGSPKPRILPTWGTHLARAPADRPPTVIRQQHRLLFRTIGHEAGPPRDRVDSTLWLMGRTRCSLSTTVPSEHPPGGTATAQKAPGTGMRPKAWPGIEKGFRETAKLSIEPLSQLFAFFVDTGSPIGFCVTCRPSPG